MGNRGVLHDEVGRIVRRSHLARWISCELEFKGRRRALLQPGRYTELFFLDEATALASGHRPCFECRRSDAMLFAAAWQSARGLAAPPRAPEMDEVLGEERRRPHRERDITGLPDGTMVEHEGTAWLVIGPDMLEWSPGGYVRTQKRVSTATVLAPATIVGVLGHGYRPRLHPSVDS